MNIRLHLLYSAILSGSMLFCLAAQALTGMNNTESRAYPVPGHGELVLDVPQHWEVTYVT